MKKIFAEFIGTFTLVLVACGVASVLCCMTGSPDTSYLMTALTFGLVVTAMAYVFSDISGCHINPAVSLGVLLSGGMGIVEFVQYVIAQLAGAVTGASVLWLLIGSNVNLGQNSLYQGDWLKSFLVETVLTAIFVLVVLCVTSDEKYSRISGLIIGLTLTVVHIFGIHFTGTSVNPARSFGPAILCGGQAISDLWVFIVAPLVGAAIAALIFRLLIQSTYYDEDEYNEDDNNRQKDKNEGKRSTRSDKDKDNDKVNSTKYSIDLFEE